MGRLQTYTLMSKFALIVPVYNEKEAIPLFCQKVQEILGPTSLGNPINSKLSEHGPNLSSLAKTTSTRHQDSFQIVFIDDGSTDGTSELLDELSTKESNISVVHFVRNFGKEAALMCGLEKTTKFDAVIPIDVDLQDPIEVIPQLIERFHQGYDYVLAQRSDRGSDSFCKRKTAEWFYKVHNHLSHDKISENVGDFRLLARKAADNVILLKEKCLFMKGIFSWPEDPAKTAIVSYKRDPRQAGKTKFNPIKLWTLALEGIFNFSTIPLKVWTYIGFAFSFLSVGYMLFIITQKFIFGIDVPGYASLMCVILLLGGLQLIGIGIIGEYLARIFKEVKQRPRWIVRE